MRVDMCNLLNPAFWKSWKWILSVCCHSLHGRLKRTAVLITLKRKDFGSEIFHFNCESQETEGHTYISAETIARTCECVCVRMCICVCRQCVLVYASQNKHWEWSGRAHTHAGRQSLRLSTSSTERLPTRGLRKALGASTQPPYRTYNRSPARSAPAGSHNPAKTVHNIQTGTYTIHNICNDYFLR